MGDLKVEVIGAKRARTRKRKALPVGRWVRAFLMRPRLLGFGASVAFFALVGTPHVGWDYECRHHKSHGQPCHSVSYCAYYGVQGRRVVFPEASDQCKVITLLRPQWENRTALSH
ncbi:MULTISPECIES: hypothetical protein [unclassified Roseitalea]|uniref:hypothetical protein n=1 Tax=unclassified Roseitalea TaxID=2639107 RepID=UPI00273FB985|nr:MULTISPECIES: hypothetical protein [unclassified Roseitalea]